MSAMHPFNAIMSEESNARRMRREGGYSQTDLDEYAAMMLSEDEHPPRGWRWKLSKAPVPSCTIVSPDGETEVYVHDGELCCYHSFATVTGASMVRVPVEVAFYALRVRGRFA